MAVELRPFGVKCNIQCLYCYQNPQRDAGNMLHRYDIELMKAAIEREGGPFVLFGGEPLLMPIADLETLWRWGLERFGENGVQTNGALVTEAHIRLFKKYQVRVGISLDGPGELNDVRWAGSVERTRQTTRKIEAVIRRLCQEGIPPTLIVTLHRGNATSDKWPALENWLLEVESMGVRTARIHLLEVDHADVRASYALTSEENCAAVRRLGDLESRLTTLRLDLFEDIRRLLTGDDDGVTCVWGACDPYTTAAVNGVEGHGQRSNCGRTNKDGIDFVKSSKEGFERYWALYHTPQEHGGCQGCRYFLFCKGQCPGTAVDNDWRNRSEHCAAWMEAFDRVERELLAAGRTPLSVSPDRPKIEAFFLKAWQAGRNTSLQHALSSVGHQAESISIQPSPVKSGDSDPDRLDFQVPPFIRVAWVSDAARESWGGRMDRLKLLLRELECRSILAGRRSCALTGGLSPRQREELREAGLVVESYGSGQFLVGTAASVQDFRSAIEAANDGAMARLLGHPECCHLARKERWEVAGLTDPIWSTAEATQNACRAEGLISVWGAPLCNSFWGRIGLSPFAHQPCRFDCPATKTIAGETVELGRALGYDSEMDWLEEIHAWPSEWSALHGIAEIRTPVMKICSQSDAWKSKRVVRWAGVAAAYPREGGTGVAFPFNHSPNMTVVAPRKNDGPRDRSAPLDKWPTSRVEPIFAEVLNHVRATGRLPDDATVTAQVTPYFNVVQLSTGGVGAAMNYAPLDDSSMARSKLSALPNSVQFWVDWLFESDAPQRELGLRGSAESDLIRSLRAALLQAACSSLLSPGPQEGFQVHHQPPRNPFRDARHAVVIGFGGYADALAASPQIERLHICDLGYANRLAEMHAFRDKYELGKITFSDGADAAEHLAKCDLAAITGSALCNGTMEKLLSMAGAKSFVIVQGQSAGLYPVPLFKRGAQMIVTTKKPAEIAAAAVADPSGASLRRYLEGGLPWLFLTPK